VHHVIPRLKPGGRKKLPHGLEAQGGNLLFRHVDGFTEKRKLFHLIFNIQGGPAHRM